MSTVASTRRQFGDGPLSRIAARVHILLVVEALLLATSLPGLVPLVLLSRDASNLPLVAACAVPLGPAVSAALHTLHHQRPDVTDLRPATVFWRGYRANLGPVLRVWLPTLAWLTVVAVNLAHLSDAGVPGWWAVLLVVVAGVVVLAGTNALVITTLFVFRTRDVVRLALYFLVRAPQVALGHAALLAAVAAVTAVTSEAVVALAGALMVLALRHIAAPMTGIIRKEWTA
ncbi:hypothetical protein CA850_04470 [Micromonospora echinospora]|uniref:DUF624 domain-containing protein n=1 Tax=Micromonospora echinospora TaxID=1877 RepID=A0A1C4ZXY0_MICEC|nr:hypothetical protein [Micromonospora echinospora]OZV83895.1 hypothetical protein CA850_04470 [Micromonospora echinospora]SCF37711.1 Protein of unknown function, DUF624 [Micromonospora echinospora]